ncbi:hypothetical protein CBS147333_2583 [Penicillium roqueforti]|nr:hypothetical protein CBS147333_2583 [Penicillium roqueforti]KAI3264117.1 hypothetical protein CBS147308_8194 [Penicillium roqueforti]KAI3284327.1 hypothetical protein DTO003C3_8099 [Penicillium roqueforti]
MTTTRHHDEADQIINQLAALAATVSNTSSNSALSSVAAAIAEPPSAAPELKLEQPEEKEEEEEEEEEESFYHLRSLITVSCLPQHTPGHTPTPSASTLGSKSGIFDRKRASSILSLHLGDLPSLPFSSKEKPPCKPCVRYTTLPPPYVHKRLVIRPEVRF